MPCLPAPPALSTLRALTGLALAATVLGLAPAPAGAAGRALKLHVPSPDWRDQIIYFALIDRFANGDPGNDDQGAGEFDPASNDRYNGGDLAGLRQHLDYIRGLGATVLWITPPVANQWLDPAGATAGYHGYWAENFSQVDRHVGTLAEYQRLSDALHRAGMYLVQDIVVNHTGNYYTYRDRWDPADPAQGWEAHDRTPPVPRPSQPPFDRNDPRDPAQRRQGIYHWTPDLVDYTDPRQVFDFQMSGLDDLNTENPQVRRALRRSYGRWIRDVGVDAFRIDTAFYVPPDYFVDFMRARDPQAPGMAEVARRTGRKDFYAFGEGFGIDRPGEALQTRRIERYMSDGRGQAVLPGMLNFPLYGALGDAFARGLPPAVLGRRITTMMALHARPHAMATFVDNHDVDRFLAGGTVAGLRQALLALMTLPGVPVIYYGTEQGYTEPRAALFNGGFGAGGRDHYDTSAPLYRSIAAMTALRRSQRLFSRGRPTVLAAEAAQAGALAWRTDHEGESALVVFNSADAEALLANLETGLPEGTLLEGLYGLEGRPAELRVGAGGRVHLRLPPRAGMVWKAGVRPAIAPAATGPITLELAPGTAPGDAAPARYTGDFGVSGRVAGASSSPLRVVVDGDLAQAQAVIPDDQGRWQARIDTSTLIDPELTHTVVAWAEGAGASPTRTFRVQREWQLLADVADPEGDDAGPEGHYRYPSDAGWGERHALDLRRVRVSGSGGAMRLEIGVRHLGASWNPPLGFDHVVFTVFIELPGLPGGATVMPLQNASLPPGMRWHRRLRVGGWTDALFSDEGASAAREGRALSPAADVKVDLGAGTLSLTLAASALGQLPSLSGAKVYVTTWDYDGGYRALAPQPLPYTFGGGPADGPKIMDDSAVIVLP